MTEQQAKQHLTKICRFFTIGSVLHLLADLQHQAADEACLADNARRFDQARTVEHTLLVVGMGIDAAQPSA